MVTSSISMICRLSLLTAKSDREAGHKPRETVWRLDQTVVTEGMPINLTLQLIKREN
jgi:hypothetical protein